MFGECPVSSYDGTLIVFARNYCCIPCSSAQHFDVTGRVTTQPFRFEGSLRMRLAEEGLRFLASTVDTLIVIPNQNLFQMVDKQTSLLDSFRSVVVVAAVDAVVVAATAASAVLIWF